jgi:hypothetical protein
MFRSVLEFPFRLFHASVSLAACSALVACVVSVEPLVPEADALFDPLLLGVWGEVAGSDRVEVSRGTGNLYEIIYASGTEEGRYHARLGELGGRRILDVWPAPVEDGHTAQRDNLMVAGHLLVALDVAGPDAVTTRRLEPDSVLAALQAGQLALDYTESDNLVLRGSTAALRAVLGPFLGWHGAFAAPTEWRRANGDSAGTSGRAVELPCFEAAAWREADRLFRSDPYWRGSDVASSVELMGGRTLWLFADTWIDASGRGTREGARMISNSLGIQDGLDPMTARMSFYWGRTPEGLPDAFFPDRDGEALWFGSGARVDDRLVLFFSRTVRDTGVGLGFEHVGWTAVLVENPDDSPSGWRMRFLPTPSNPLGVLLGFTASFRLGDHVYALGVQNPVKTHPIFAARWPADQVRRGDLSDPEWWAGGMVGWVPDSSSTQRWPLFENAQTELTVHYDRATGKFLTFHTQGFGQADLVGRAAPTLTGPWSRAQMVYRPPEYYRPNIMIYAAKAHPHLVGADLVLTYATNSLRFGDHADQLIYFPRFVRLSRCDEFERGNNPANP